jgi:hypothetical protein
VADGRAAPLLKRVAIALEQDNQDSCIQIKYLQKNDLVKKKLLLRAGDESNSWIQIVSIVSGCVILIVT